MKDKTHVLSNQSLDVIYHLSSQNTVQEHKDGILELRKWAHIEGEPAVQQHSQTPLASLATITGRMPRWEDRI